ncbi:MAG: hypothetical protein RMM53_11250, partial [Bacteroidia bacterium]|nr:hypothetical protein [Bacteroidia bacterium]
MKNMNGYLSQARRLRFLPALMLLGGYTAAQVVPPCDPPVPAAIQGLSPHYCFNSPPVTLVGSPPGGQFHLDAANVPPMNGLSGNGVLNPSAFQPGT